jgi:RNA polymerase sigma-70 factor (ECF subfamily)
VQVEADAVALERGELAVEVVGHGGQRFLAGTDKESHAHSDATAASIDSYDQRVTGGTDPLVELARAGDLDAFERFVREHERRVRAVVARLLDDRRDVEEAAQDVFVRAWRTLPEFRGESSVSTWLYRIAVNEALQRRRRSAYQVVELIDAPAPEPADPELRRSLLAAIGELPVEQRAALVLRDVVGLSNDEVAAVLGLTVEAAKSRIHRARLQVRAALAQAGV